MHARTFLCAQAAVLDAEISRRPAWLSADIRNGQRVIVVAPRAIGSHQAWQTHPVRISHANTGDVAGLARLLWLDTHNEEPAQRSVDAFAAELAQWWPPVRIRTWRSSLGSSGRRSSAWPGSRSSLASQGQGLQVGYRPTSRASSSCRSSEARGSARRWWRLAGRTRHTSGLQSVTRSCSRWGADRRIARARTGNGERQSTDSGRALRSGPARR